MEKESLESEPTKRRKKIPEDERLKLIEQYNQSQKLINPRKESRRLIDPRNKGTKPVEEDVQFTTRGRARGKILKSFLEGPKPLGKNKHETEENYDSFL